MIVAGALSALLLPLLAQGGEDLTEELFAEEQWAQCRAECLRVLGKAPENHRTLLTSLKAGTRLGGDHIAELAAFTENTLIDKELRCEADFELATIYQKNNKPADALRHLVSCFNSTDSGALFASATRLANTILKANAELEQEHKELVNVIRTASKTWPRNKKESKSKASPILARPALWLITFYQHQIGPAIGARCSLHPSCSRYAVDAIKEHGLKGIAIAGDRMVREPDVVAAKATPVIISNQIKYEDPISHHTFWLKEKSK